MGACCKVKPVNKPLAKIYNRINNTPNSLEKAQEAVKNASSNISMENGYVKLDVNDWMDQDLFQFMKFGYCADEEQFKELFADAGVNVKSIDDLDMLTKLTATGGDLKGVLKRADGTPLKFSVVNTFGKMQLSTAQVDACKARFDEKEVAKFRKELQ